MNSITGFCIVTVVIFVHWKVEQVWCHNNTNLDDSAVVAGKELIFSHIVS